MPLMMFWLIFMSLAFTAYAVSPGTLDANFGTSGVALRNISTSNDEILAVAIQSDNKIVAVGYSEGTPVFTITRFNTNGTPDTGFGTGGLVQTSFALPNNNLVDVPSYAYTVAIQSDGKIVVAGDIGFGRAFGLARYTSTGQLDSSFGNGGKVITETQNVSALRQIAIQSDGKIIAVGSTTVSDFAVVRYTTGGALDTTFGGGDGIAITDFYNEADNATSVKLQSDGKIVVAGGAVEPDFLTTLFAVARYNTNGSLDTSFNGNGLKTVFTECGPDALGCGAETMGIQPDGKIAVAAGNDDIYLARFNADGSQINGVITTNIGGSSDKAYSMAIDSAGAILIAGSTLAKGDENFFVAKYLSSGVLDQSFDNGDGIVITPLGSNSDIGHAIAVQPNAGIIVGGSKGDFGAKEFALVRYLGVQPTAANALITGRIVSANGSGISNVRVALTNGQGTTVYAITSSFGYYSFYDIPVGQTYIITPNSTRYTFTPSSLVITLMDDLTTANFTAQ